MRRAVLLLVVLALAAGGYLLWQAHAEHGSGDTETVKREAPATSAEPLRLEGRSAEAVPPAPRPAVPEGLEGIDLPEGASIEAPPLGSARAVGRVVDAEGKPVAGAHVEAVVARAEQLVFVLPGGGASGPSVGTDTGTEGRFAFALLAEGTDYDLVATTPTTYRATVGPFTASLEKPIEAEIRLPPSRWLDVRVVDAAGKTPIAGASVRWSSADDPTPQGIWTFVVERVGEMRGDSPKTDAQGAIRIGPLPPGPLDLTASAKTYVRSPAPVLVPADGAGSVEIALAKGLAIDGRVVKPDGDPAASVEVMFQPARQHGFSMPDLAKTDDKGVFHLDGLAPGRYRIDVSLGELVGHAVAETGERDVLVTLASATAEDAAVEERSFPVHIRVVGADGSAVDSAAVSMQGPSFKASTRLTNGEASIDCPVDPVGGSIVVSNPVDEKGARLPWGQTQYGPLRAGETDVTIRLVRTRTIEGRVTDADGAPLEQVEVSVGGIGIYGMSSRTRADGTFVLNGLGDEEYDLRAQVPPDFLRPAAVKVRGGDRGVEIRVRRGSRPIVTVVDAKGDPVAGATVTTEGPAEASSDEPFVVSSPSDGGAKTRADGRLRLAALAEGVPVALVVKPPESRSDLREARLDAWVPADVTVTLTPGSVVRGRVQDVTGKPVRAYVQARLGDDRATVVHGGEDGSFEIRELPAGRITLRAYVNARYSMEGARYSLERWYPDDKPDAEVVAVAGAKDVVLVVARRAKLRVVVENLPADPGDDFDVTVQAGSEVYGTSVRADGTAEFDDLSADGPYRLFAGATPDGLMAYREAVRPADGEVRLRLVLGKTVTVRITAPPGAQDTEVWVGDAPVWLTGVVRADGRYEVRGLPDGTWLVAAGATVGSRSLSGSARVAAGSSGDIELK